MSSIFGPLIGQKGRGRKDVGSGVVKVKTLYIEIKEIKKDRNRW